MKAFINSLYSINPCTSQQNGWPPIQPALGEKTYYSCIEPDYKEIIHPNLIRRMGRVIKMGVASSMKCLKEAGIESPDAIITGTSLGCIEDTEKFLNQVEINKEQFLAPTSFIQSTHNTIAGQIALLLQCNAYNFTFVHRNFSFENAILDTLMMLEENPEYQILLGGVDEITPVSYKIMNRLGIYHNDNNPVIGGEGAHFFVVSKKPLNAIAKFEQVKTYLNPATDAELFAFFESFFKSSEIKPENFDAVIMGFNNDSEWEQSYQKIDTMFFNRTNILSYKNLSGEYFTSSAYAVWAAANILQGQNIPDTMKYRFSHQKPLRNLLIYNRFKNSEHSLIHLSAC